jgi:hypothetical protein
MKGQAWNSEYEHNSELRDKPFFFLAEGKKYVIPRNDPNF